MSVERSYNVYGKGCQTLFLQGGTGLAFAEKARCVIRTNYHGLLNVTNAFAPLLHANSR